MIINNYEVDVSKMEVREINGVEYWARQRAGKETLFNKTSKSCPKCGDILKYDEFVATKIGFLNVASCKRCKKKYEKDNADRIVKYAEQYRKDNIENRRQYDAQYKKDNAEKISKYRKDNIERIRERDAQYKKDNAEKIKVRKRSYYERNTEKIEKYYKDNVERFSKNSKKWNYSYAKYNSNKLPLGYKTRDLGGLLQVQCYSSRCKEWHFVTNSELKRRLVAESAKGNGSHNLYCSAECKDSCSEYYANTTKDEKAHDLGLSVAEYDTLMSSDRGIWKQTLRDAKDIALHRDGFKCQQCASESDLQVHHIKPVAVCLDTDDEYLVYEVDNMITLCHDCHKDEHRTVAKTGSVSRCAGGDK